MNIRHFLPVILVALLWALSACSEDETPPQGGGPRFSLDDFASARACSSCHPQYYDEWNGSMHHYATNDPIWNLAINSLQASTGGRLKEFCWQCHSPIGFLTGNTPPTFQIADLPPLVREGVTCDVCHTLRAPHTTTNQRIAYNITPGFRKYSQLSDPIPTGGHDHGYDPSFARSEKCRECHDLIVNNIPVEITFTEWQNSAWGAMSVECQDCHMPTYTGVAAVGGPLRQNLHRHDMPGVDIPITDFPNKERTRAAVDSLLRNAACMSVEVPTNPVPLQDSVRFKVKVCNDRTGHNIPTSVFFFRQMWVEVTVWNGGDTVYRSGHLDANGDLMDRNSAINPRGDPDLALFGGELFKNGQPSNVFEFDSLVNNSIPPFVTKTAHYKFKALRPGLWTVRARLLFRPFGPYLFRAVGANQYINELPIFEMTTQTAMVNVQ